MGLRPHQAEWDAEQNNPERIAAREAHRIAAEAQWEEHKRKRQEKLDKGIPPQPFETPTWMVYMNTMQQFVNEGAEMHHCIANYFEDAHDGYYSYWSINLNGERASMELKNHNLEIRQLYTKANRPVSHALKMAVQDLLSEVEVHRR